MAAESAGQGELTQLVTDHVLGNKNRDELIAIVHSQSVTDELGGNGAAPRPGFDHLLLIDPVELIDLGQQIGIDEGPLFNLSCHVYFRYFLRFTIRRSEDFFFRVLYPLVGLPQGVVG